MHNIKLIRKDPNYFTKKFNERNVDVDLTILLDLDKKNRELIQKKENLEQVNIPQQKCEDSIEEALWEVKEQFDLDFLLLQFQFVHQIKKLFRELRKEQIFLDIQ